MNASTFGCALVFAALIAAASSAHAIEARYVCDKGARINVQFSPPIMGLGHATLTFARSGETIVLPQVMSADGGRYANSQIEFWIKGKDARLMRDGKAQACRTR